VAPEREAKSVQAALGRAFPSLSAREIREFSGTWEPVRLGAGQSVWLVEEGTRRMVLCAGGRLCHLRLPDGKARPRCLRILPRGDVAGLPLLGRQPYAYYPEKAQARLFSAPRCNA
jgi:hypothetical protein